MAIATYGDLKAAIAAWLDRTDLAARIPEFVGLAEANIAREVRARVMEKRAIAELDQRYGELPSDLLELRNVQLNTDPIRRLEYMSPEMIDANVHGVGVPRYYTVLGKEFQLAPRPDAPYEVELAYYARPPALHDDADTHELLATCPGLYLYGALVAAVPYLQNEERAQTWALLYEREVQAINRTDRLARFSGSSLMARSDVGTP